MFVSHLALRSWLARWFGGRRQMQAQGEQQPAGGTEPLNQAPLFSLGDTKQDVVVSFRGSPAEES